MQNAFRKILLFAALLLPAMQPALKAQSKQAKSPNILLLLTDDAGYADFGFTTSRLVPTPTRIPENVDLRTEIH